MYETNETSVGWERAQQENVPCKHEDLSFLFLSFYTQGVFNVSYIFLLLSIPTLTL